MSPASRGRCWTRCKRPDSAALVAGAEVRIHEHLRAARRRRLRRRRSRRRPPRSWRSWRTVRHASPEPRRSPWEASSRTAETSNSMRPEKARTTGSMTGTEDGNRFTVDLACARTTDDGLIVIAGTVSASTFDPFTEQRAAIVLQRGSPVKGLLLEQPAEGQLLGVPRPRYRRRYRGCHRRLEPIEGTIELRP